ncbi:MAG: hypothetical protein COA82_10700 [Alkaliphilus sp.]|nr:MAG: hypothetical protein COA82_10700 [Alkaliphilus sp.]
MELVASCNDKLKNILLLREKREKRELTHQLIEKLIISLNKYKNASMTREIVLLLFKEIILYRGKKIEIKLQNEEEIKAIGEYSKVKKL